MTDKDDKTFTLYEVAQMLLSIPLKHDTKIRGARVHLVYTSNRGVSCSYTEELGSLAEKHP